ncbi:MAG: Ig-like domain-containing protein [Solirubrobacterales bacterium]
MNLRIRIGISLFLAITLLMGGPLPGIALAAPADTNALAASVYQRVRAEYSASIIALTPPETILTAVYSRSAGDSSSPNAYLPAARIVIKASLATFTADAAADKLPSFTDTLMDGGVKTLVKPLIEALSPSKLKKNTPEQIFDEVFPSVEQSVRERVGEYAGAEIVKQLPNDIADAVYEGVYEIADTEAKAISLDNLNRIGLTGFTGLVGVKSQPVITQKTQTYLTDKIKQAVPPEVLSLLPEGAEGMVQEKVYSAVYEKFGITLPSFLSSGEDEKKEDKKEDKKETPKDPKGYKPEGYVDVAPDQVWILQFSDALDRKTIASGIRVSLDPYGLIKTKCEAKQTFSTMIRVKPLTTWTKGCTYYLTVSTALKSVNGQVLAKPVTIKFTVKKDKSLLAQMKEIRDKIAAGDYAGALAQAQEVTGVNPRDYRAFAILAEALAPSDPEAADEALDQAKELNPNALELKATEAKVKTAQAEQKAADQKDDSGPGTMDLTSISK